MPLRLRSLLKPKKKNTRKEKTQSVRLSVGRADTAPEVIWRRSTNITELTNLSESLDRKSDKGEHVSYLQ